MSGLDSTGFSPKLVDEVLEDIEGEELANIDPALDLQPEEPLGQVNGIFAAALAEAWQALAAVYASAFPDSATGAALDAICVLTGVQRLAAAPSSVNLFAIGTNGTVLSLGRIASSPTTGTRFTTTEAGTIATATAWASATAYTVGLVRSNGGNLYRVTVAGTSAGSGGPTTTSTAITDGTVTWRYLGAGSAYAEVEAQCEEDGATSANAGTVTQIDTPVSGWSTVTNAVAATLGRDEETDEDLRIRRRALLSTSGNATVDAIRDAVLRVDDVTAAYVYANDTDATVDSIPAHAIEVVVTGGAAQDIRDAILASKAAGITAYGTTSGTAVDAQGFTHDIDFTVPTTIDTEAAIVVTTDDDYPADGDDQIAAAVADHVNALGVDGDVIRNKLFDIIFNISGVVDVTTLNIGLLSGVLGTSNIAITARQIAALDAGDVAVTS